MRPSFWWRPKNYVLYYMAQNIVVWFLCFLIFHSLKKKSTFLNFSSFPVLSQFLFSSFPVPFQFLPSSLPVPSQLFSKANKSKGSWRKLWGSVHWYKMSFLKSILKQNAVYQSNFQMSRQCLQRSDVFYLTLQRFTVSTYIGDGLQSEDFQTFFCMNPTYHILGISKSHLSHPLEANMPYHWPD